MQIVSKTNQKIINDIQRSLQRLKIIFHQANPTSALIPAFFYSAKLLNDYAKVCPYEDINSTLFSTFKELIQQFATQDFSAVTKNGQMIVDQILQIVDSSLFMTCLNPQVKTSREKLLRSINQGDQFQFYNNNQRTEGTKLKQLFSYKKQAQLKDKYQKLWENILQNYNVHNLDQAYIKSLNYLQTAGKVSKISQQRLQFMKMIAQQYNKMISFYEQFDKPGFIFDKQENGVLVEYKVYQKENTVAIRMTGQFDIPISSYLSIVSEIDLMALYVPFCYDTKPRKIISRNSRIGSSKIYIPLLTDRYTYFYAVGYDRINVTNSIFLYSKTITDDLQFQKKVGYTVEKQPQLVNLEYKFFVTEYIPIGLTRAKIRMCSKIDMKINFLPLFIINRSARIFAFDYFKNIIDICNNFKDSPWQKKIAQNAQYYDFFKKRVKQCLGQLHI